MNGRALKPKKVKQLCDTENRSIHCPACGAFLPESNLEIDNPDLKVYNQKCTKCGAELDYVPGLFTK